MPLSSADRPDRTGVRVRRPAALVASASALAFGVLALAVQTHLTQPWDDVVRQFARPDDVWGPLQRDVDLVVEGLRPKVVVVPTALVTLGVCLRRRSLRPALVAAAVGALGVVLVLGIKVGLGRPDPHDTDHTHGGSFPSGHTFTLLVCSGLVLVLLRPGARRAWLPTVLPAAAMGVSLVIQAAHWASDVIGGALLGAVVLAGLVALGVPHWAAAERRRQESDRRR